MTGSTLIDELSKAPHDEVSVEEAIIDVSGSLNPCTASRTVYDMHFNTLAVDYTSPTDAMHGRFFAVNELTALLAHLVMTYDVRLEKEGEGELPSSMWFGQSLAPNMQAEVMFRKRRS
ncbi:uncharacterized protein LAESUDRAFT_757954 [Laetiporus sulphureus 93-53]|uniref:Uncharacterized protein n=1 Tax=Laetiporus sulphureus 93-53 TaxID=1314785 RepID=A0A165F343_9APHY|nr:uncharacterized protein LAESUDRAFT_757954 [Laetiporus sulphureus 93-53]KZT08276.1 hypothetical protein LAESUDRAFT_757954 [Laetiporus sulphureus 93-53]